MRASPRRKAKQILALIERRISTRKPAAYLVNKIYMRGLPFYVDERSIVPRSFIGELLDSHFGGDEDATSLIGDPAEVEPRARPLHRQRLPCDPRRPPFSQCRDRCGGYFEGCARGCRTQCRRITGWTIASRCTAAICSRRSPASATTSSSPTRPMSMPRAWRRLPRECRAEPKLAFDGGADGIDIVRRILERGEGASQPAGRIVVRDRPRPRQRWWPAYPQLPLLWLDTEDSEGEVFWIAASDL